MNDHLLRFDQRDESAVFCRLDLGRLYDSSSAQAAFDERFEEFVGSDSNLGRVIERDGNHLLYWHKTWVPHTPTLRVPLLLAFGNPAPHSVIADVYFAYEGSGREHRLWRVLRELGVCDLRGDDPDVKQKLFAGIYQSDFQIGMDVLFTFPSPASHKRWSGVMGLERLFGAPAMRLIVSAERTRWRAVASTFLANSGGVIAMQKDAYNALALNTYSLRDAGAGNLRSDLGGRPILGTPPTRWLYTLKMHDALLSSLRYIRDNSK